MILGCVVRVYRRTGLKFSAAKSKMMVLGGEEGVGHEVCLDRMQLEHASEFKYLGWFFFNESGTDTAVS